MPHTEVSEDSLNITGQHVQANEQKSDLKQPLLINKLTSTPNTSIIDSWPPSTRSSIPQLSSSVTSRLLPRVRLFSSLFLNLQTFALTFLGLRFYSQARSLRQCLAPRLNCSPSWQSPYFPSQPFSPLATAAQDTVVTGTSSVRLPALCFLATPEISAPVVAPLAKPALRAPLRPIRVRLHVRLAHLERSLDFPAPFSAVPPLLGTMPPQRDRLIRSLVRPGAISP